MSEWDDVFMGEELKFEVLKHGNGVMARTDEELGLIARDIENGIETMDILCPECYGDQIWVERRLKSQLKTSYKCTCLLCDCKFNVVRRAKDEKKELETKGLNFGEFLGVVALIIFLAGLMIGNAIMTCVGLSGFLLIACLMNFN